MSGAPAESWKLERRIFWERAFRRCRVAVGTLPALWQGQALPWFFGCRQELFGLRARLFGFRGGRWSCGVRHFDCRRDRRGRRADYGGGVPSALLGARYHLGASNLDSVAWV